MLISLGLSPPDQAPSPALRRPKIPKARQRDPPPRMGSDIDDATKPLRQRHWVCNVTTWPAIRDRWIDSWRNREVRPGESVTARVGPEDEWVAEAYMETDYSTLTQRDFERVLLDYALFTLGHGEMTGDEE